MMQVNYLRLPIVSALGISLILSGTAKAEAPIDWYIELKREAKYARIRAHGGASKAGLLPHSEATARLITRAGQWDGTAANPLAKQVCVAAAQRLQAAFNMTTAQGRHDAIVDGERDRDSCLAAIQRR